MIVRTVLDWETAYGKHPETGVNHTLSKITVEEYVRSNLFKVHGLGVKIEREKAFYLYKRDDLLQFLKTHPWGRSYVIGHHTHFDGAILSWRAGIRPAMWGCTLSMARALYPHESVSLSNIARLLGLGEKGLELVNFINLWELTDAQQHVLGSYCCNDIDLTSAAFDAMKGRFPVSELRLIDLTIRMFTEPVLQVERGVLVEEYKRERRSKRALLKKCQVEKAELASGDKFAALLLTLGVDPPKKLSPAKVKDGRVNPDNVGEPPLGLLPSFVTKGLPVEQRAEMKEAGRVYPWAYAFGKNDEEFKLLLDHPDEQVQAVVEARFGIKSTIKETRSKRFFKIGKRGAFPVYHNYYGARTGRWCLTGNTEIFVLRGGEVRCILLPELRPDDLVWDGLEFVTHGGLVCRGQQEVITYDGITGTPGHKVFCEETDTAVSLSTAAEKHYTLKVADLPGERAVAPADSNNGSTEREAEAKV